MYNVLKEERCQQDHSPKAVTEFFDYKLKGTCENLGLKHDDGDKGYIIEYSDYRFYVCGGDFDFEIGFERKINTTNQEIEDEKLELYKGLLKNNGFEIADEKNKTYVCSRINPLKGYNNIDEFITYHKEKIETIRDKFMKIK